MSSNSENSIKQAFIKNDPVIWFLTQSLKMPIWGLPAIMFVISIVLLLGVASILGMYDSFPSGALQSKMFAGTKQHPEQLVISLFVQPVIVGYYLQLSQRVRDVYFDLLKSGVIPMQYKRNYEKEISKIESIFNNRKVYIVGILFGIAITAWVVDLASNDNFWYHQFKVIFWVFEIPKTFITGYAITMIGLRVLIFQWGLSKIYSTIPTWMHPLHEDGAGGYAPVGKIVGSYFYWLLAGFGFYSAAGLQQYFTEGQIPEYLVVQFIVLPIIATIAFFLPLISTHNAMQAATRRLLVKYSQKYADIENELFSDKKLSYSKKIEELFVLANAVEKIRKSAPVWPFDTQIQNRFFASLGASLLPLVFTVFQEYVLPVILSR